MEAARRSQSVDNSEHFPLSASFPHHSQPTQQSSIFHPHSHSRIHSRPIPRVKESTYEEEYLRPKPSRDSPSRQLLPPKIPVGTTQSPAMVDPYEQVILTSPARVTHNFSTIHPKPQPISEPSVNPSAHVNPVPVTQEVFLFKSLAKSGRSQLEAVVANITMDDFARVALRTRVARRRVPTTFVITSVPHRKLMGGFLGNVGGTTSAQSQTNLTSLINPTSSESKMIAHVRGPSLPPNLVPLAPLAPLPITSPLISISTPSVAEKSPWRREGSEEDEDEFLRSTSKAQLSLTELMPGLVLPGQSPPRAVSLRPVTPPKLLQPKSVQAEGEADNDASRLSLKDKTALFEDKIAAFKTKRQDRRSQRYQTQPITQVWSLVLRLFHSILILPPI